MYDATIINISYLTQYLSLHRCVTRPERPKGAKDEVKQARRAAIQKSGPNGPLDFYDDHNRLIMVTLTNNIITTVMMIKNEQLVGRGSWLQSQRL